MRILQHGFVTPQIFLSLHSSMKQDAAVLEGDRAFASAGQSTIHKTASNVDESLTALDLYSGIGGWALGLKMAGIKVVASYERAPHACATQTKNQGGEVVQCDIRKKLPGPLPKVSVVVGSPPCTEFSFSNKGGNGDINNGLRDLARFLALVDEVKPRFWVFENVPRVKNILQKHLYGRRGKLRKFQHLFNDPDVHIRIVDMSQFGLPQKRLRCLAGKFPADLLESYVQKYRRRTLASVLNALRSKIVKDSVYGFQIDRSALTDNELEIPLSREEIRLNRDAKTFHPVYNRMEFPDLTSRPVRAITATCTRVSRESIVIRSPGKRRSFRRLTLRERASLQGFPVTYQFFANSYSKKIEMIGNAIPPLFVYYLGCAFRGVKPDDLLHPDEIGFKHSLPQETAPHTLPGKNKRGYPATRRFRAAIPSLRFKSGVRFEFANHFSRGCVAWRVSFVFGNSKDIRILRPDGRQSRQMEGIMRRLRLLTKLDEQRRLITNSSSNVPADLLQSRWAHRAGGSGPHGCIQSLSVAARSIAAELKRKGPAVLAETLLKISALQKASKMKLIGSSSMNVKKFETNVAYLLAGLIVASWYNSSPSVKANAPQVWKPAKN